MRLKGFWILKCESSRQRDEGLSDFKVNGRQGRIRIDREKSSFHIRRWKLFLKKKSLLMT